MTGLRGLAFLIAVCLPAMACTAQTEDEGCDDMRQVIQEGHGNEIQQWGASAILTPAWAKDQQRPVLQHKPFRAGQRGYAAYCIPVAQSMMLSAKRAGSAAGANYAFRWVLNVGGGGGSQPVKFDAVNLQQLAIAAENIDVSMVCESPNLDGSVPFTPPSQTVTATVSFADGNVSSSAATYTQTFTVPGAGGVVIAVPPFMATSFRLLGASGGADDPLVATTSVALQQSAVAVVSFTGDKLAPLQYGDGFIPLPGLTTSMTILNQGAAAINGLLQWGLDL